MTALFSKPKVSDPARMPVEGDAVARAAADRARREAMARSGQASTVLSQGNGTGAYKNTVLGQA